MAVIGFFVALSLLFHENRLWRPFLGTKVVALLSRKEVNFTQMPANYATCVVASNIIGKCELPILFFVILSFFVVE